MVARRPSGVFNRHRGFQNIGLPKPVFTVENSTDNNPIHTTYTKSRYTAWIVSSLLLKNIRPTARPAELHNVILGQFRRTSGSVLNVDWLRTSSCREKLSNYPYSGWAILEPYRQGGTRCAPPFVSSLFVFQLPLNLAC